MSNPQPSLDREAKRHLAVIHHVEDVTGNVAMTCRCFGSTECPSGAFPVTRQ
jgi:hypothetical protein